VMLGAVFDAKPVACDQLFKLFEIKRLVRTHKFGNR
jgi:hypothetical protein